MEIKNHPNFYEMALLLADGQSHQSEDRWGSFIDNLSRICNEFAYHISPKEKRCLASWQPQYNGRISVNPNPKSREPAVIFHEK